MKLNKSFRVVRLEGIYFVETHASLGLKMMNLVDNRSVCIDCDTKHAELRQNFVGAS